MVCSVCVCAVSGQFRPCIRHARLWRFEKARLAGFYVHRHNKGKVSYLLSERD